MMRTSRSSGVLGGLLVLLLLLNVASGASLTSFVNLFIGTSSGANGGSGGNAFPGAAVPHAMVKTDGANGRISEVGIDVDETPRQAGYIDDNSSITGISLMHDEGTGGNTAGGYGFFPLFPLSNCTFEDCPVGINARKTLRAAGADAATPGYFTTTFINDIKLETTSTRRAGLIRFTYPSDLNETSVVVDLTNDLQRSFEGGTLEIDSSSGRVTLSGTFLQSYGTDNYTAYACYDFTPSNGTQALTQYGTYQSINASSPTDISVAQNSSSLSFAYTSSPSPIQAGALLSFSIPANSDSGSRAVLARFGVSFISTDQACANAENEIPGWDWDAVQNASESKWEDVLNRVEINTSVEDATVVELLYSSLYRSQLVPANLTGENPYWDSPYPFYDALFCSWDTFRTVHPLLSLTSPREWAEIVNTYVDGWRNTGYIPECRANSKKGYVQGGSDGMPILGDFAVKYGARGSELGVPVDDLYQALVDTAENTPPDWYMVGRQNTAWKTFDYIPTNWTDPSGAIGLPTREASRTLEYALGDFAVRQAGIALNKSDDDVYKYGNRSMGFLNVWDPNVTSDGFTGFAQRRFANGTFAFSDPVDCSPLDTVGHSCARGTDNDVGFYESSSWEYSFFAPHSMSSIVDVVGGNDTFVNRTTHYFTKGYFLAGNEPSFAMPLAYHYANRPDLSALRVRDVVYSSFGTGIGGIPGNDDSGAMAALLTFHILGLYPVPASNQLLLGSPLVSAFTLHNDLLNTSTTFTVSGFDASSLAAVPGNGSRLYVSSVSVNGQTQGSICWIAFEDVVGGGEIVITVDGDADAASVRGCGSSERALPDSLATGGFPIS
ncbi:glycosyl hydrolase family 92-domain-containing protein [Phellopilus nigrolimitatus]|nr:glycosyl hydrolase family 92-domain-containing protein [Phellopilus nigrolimitatus]